MTSRPGPAVGGKSRSKRPQPRTHACADCPTLITAKAIRCKPCHGRYAGADPEFARVRREANLARYRNPDLLDQQRARIAKATAMRVQASLGWCPPDLLGEYRRLTRVRTNGRRMAALEAKRAILASLSPFERQELALLNGTRLVEVAPVRVQLSPGHSPFEVVR